MWRKAVTRPSHYVPILRRRHIFSPSKKRQGSLGARSLASNGPDLCRPPGTQRSGTIPYSPIDVFAPQGMVAAGGLWHESVTPTVVPPRLGSRGQTIQSRRQRQHSEKFDRLPPFGLWRDCPKGVVAVLAWISTDRNWPHKTPSRMPIFRVLSHRCCDAKGYADNPIALRLLAHRLCDSGHFRDPRGEKRLRTGVYQNTDLANGHRRILESCESLSDLDVRAISLRGNPG